MAETKIEWTAWRDGRGAMRPGYTFNPWIGCTKISAGCDNCYAETWAQRFGDVQWGNHDRKRTSTGNWRKPYQWAKLGRESGGRPKVFCGSLCDVFDNQVPVLWRQPEPTNIISMDRKRS
ncbi:DUF5131 family protein [Bradyrhizobium sp. Ai1a-2]|uniref:DUF5131 family protein n=1 Tax=Bradyrhizobium sp. Ai1a-2 TaxID=196490 RepID=UPI00041AFD1C|nr:DUF5131 family protein [Bradyrhizobium sp. Ai1a-2]